jgi:phosphoribosylanthranilate isomerase
MNAVSTVGRGHGNVHVCSVKLCGLRCEEDMDAALEAGADAVGMVVDVPGARRSISPAHAAGLVKHLRLHAGELHRKPPKTVGVFVDEPIERVVDIAREARLDAVQLHGREDEDYVMRLRSRLEHGDASVWSVGIVQAFQVHDTSDVNRARGGAADLVLLDAGAGAGVAFDWALARDFGRPFILAGGLNPGNVAEAVHAVRPLAVDMSSGVETDGVKDPSKMRAAVAAVRAACPCVVDTGVGVGADGINDPHTMRFVGAEIVSVAVGAAESTVSSAPSASTAPSVPVASHAPTVSSTPETALISDRRSPIKTKSPPDCIP